MNKQRDPIQTITEAIGVIVAPFGVKLTVLGWPDPATLQIDGGLPILAVYPVNDAGKTVTSTEKIHAAINNGDGTKTVYKEKLRKEYLLQLSLFTYTEEERSNIGWLIEQYFATNQQLIYGIIGVETGIIKYRGTRNPKGENRLFQRDISYEVSGRVLDAVIAKTANTIKTNQSAMP